MCVILCNMTILFVPVTILSKMDKCVHLHGLFLQAKPRNRNTENYGKWKLLEQTNGYKLVECFNNRDVSSIRYTNKYMYNDNSTASHTE